jgi:acyl carrier protein
MANLAEETSFLLFIAKELGESISEINFETIFRNLNSWSSLNALYLITRISEEERIFISSDELAKCTTFQDIHKLISIKIAENQ